MIQNWFSDLCKKNSFVCGKGFVLSCNLKQSYKSLKCQGNYCKYFTNVENIDGYAL